MKHLFSRQTCYHQQKYNPITLLCSLNYNHYLLLFSFLFLFTACSEQRFSFRKKIKADNHKTEKFEYSKKTKIEQSEIRKTAMPFVEETKDITVLSEKKMNLFHRSSLVKYSIHKRVNHLNTKHYANKANKHFISQNSNLPKEDDKKEYNWYAIAGLIFFSIPLITALSIVLFSLSKSVSVLIPLSIILGFIFSLIGFAGLKKYKGKGFAIAGFTISMLIILVFLIFILSGGIGNVF